MAVLIPDAIERPHEHTPAVRAKALDYFLESIVEWLRSEGEKDAGKTAESLDEIRRDVAKATEYHTDGYEIAKELDDAGWSPDEQLVELCGHWWVDLNRAETEAVKAWVKEVEPKPLYKRGDIVEGWHGGDRVRGVVVRIDEAEAKYTIRGTDDPKGSGAIIKYEKIIGRAAQADSRVSKL